MRSPSTSASRPRIAVVGAGFAGLTAARQLGRQYDVTVLDGSPWFEWLPNTHELLSGVKRPADLRLPHRALVARSGHRFVNAAVAEVDATAGRLVTSGGRRIGFDACIVAVGGVHDTFGVPGADRHAMSFKGVDDCHAIGRRLAQLALRPGRHSVVIVGGGLEGIEAIGEILRRFRHRDAFEVSVVEAGARLLPGAPSALDAAVRAHCARHEVRVLTRSRVTQLTAGRVRLDTGETLRSDLTMWTGGSAPSPLLQASGLADGPRSWAPVKASLQSRRFDNVFVAGDAAALPRPLGKQAYYAMQMGECAADNVVRALAGRRLRDFSPSRKPMLVAFGDLDTFLVSGKAVVASPALAAAKEAIFQLTMARLDPSFGAAAVRRGTSRLVRAAEELALPALTVGSDRRRAPLPSRPVRARRGTGTGPSVKKAAGHRPRRRPAGRP
jgi:NADH dehydrogenase FAD-containing subunit